MMDSRLLLIAALMSIFSTVSWAEADCAAQAVDKKLAGLALDNFMVICQNGVASAACEAAATEKKLEGKVRKAFVKDCAKDTLGK